MSPNGGFGFLTLTPESAERGRAIMPTSGIRTVEWRRFFRKVYVPASAIAPFTMLYSGESVRFDVWRRRDRIEESETLGRCGSTTSDEERERRPRSWRARREGAAQAQEAARQRLRGNRSTSARTDIASRCAVGA
jgi:hypothetical protein